ncbi:uncharacterized protein METZ01_LOCUS153442 [marine metagenome]|uniref:Uncharacterized protein n=1 Tax=marine metagenome TaxID=408172 RepID=A0A382AGE9_9ZZZZ
MFDLSPLPVITVILLTLVLKHLFINSSIVLLAFSKEKPCKSIVFTGSLSIFICGKDKSLL